MARNDDAVRFNFRCPYTDKHCDIWNCESCSVNAREEEWMKEREDAVTEESTRLEKIKKALATIGVTEIKEYPNPADAKWQKRIEAIKDEINRYWLNCDFAVDDPECKQCGQNVFGSILRIIDKHTKEGGEKDGRIDKSGQHPVDLYR